MLNEKRSSFEPLQILIGSNSNQDKKTDSPIAGPYNQLLLEKGNENKEKTEKTFFKIHKKAEKKFFWEYAFCVHSFFIRINFIRIMRLKFGEI